jgi:hypothetical protein
VRRASVFAAVFFASFTGAVFAEPGLVMVGWGRLVTREPVVGTNAGGSLAGNDSSEASPTSSVLPAGSLVDAITKKEHATERRGPFQIPGNAKRFPDSALVTL